MEGESFRSLALVEGDRLGATKLTSFAFTMIKATKIVMIDPFLVAAFTCFSFNSTRSHDLEPVKFHSSFCITRINFTRSLFRRRLGTREGAKNIVCLLHQNFPQQIICYCASSLFLICIVFSYLAYHEYYCTCYIALHSNCIVSFLTRP